MNKAETAQLLTLLAAFDQRTLDQTDVEAWHMALKDVPLDESTKDAVAAFYGDSGGEERRFMQPHNLRTGRKRLRADRLEKITPRPAPNAVEGVSSPEEERAVIRAIGDGVISSQADAEAYTAWGGSLHVAYLREDLPALERMPRLALTARPVKELIAGVFPAPEGLKEARRALSEPRAEASGPPMPTMSVPCPWAACRAPAGMPCLNGAGDPIPPHPARRAVTKPAN